VLGKGGFATVYKALCLSNNQEVAIKMVRKVNKSVSMLKIPSHAKNSHTDRQGENDRFEYDR
jgi:serine/threonine protein kinase